MGDLGSFAATKAADVAEEASKDVRTPAQRLLQSLRAGEVARKERTADTTAAKLREAREKLPNIVSKHPVPSDQAFLGKPVEEVHQLPADVQAHKPSLEGIKAMLQAKAAKHEAAWQSYLTARDVAVQQLQHTSEVAVKDLKDRLAASEAAIQEELQVLQDAQLMVLHEADVHQVWASLAASRQQRRTWVKQLGDTLGAAEGQLLQQVEKQLLATTQQLLDIAFLDPGQVQHLLEQETLDMNVQVLDRKRLADAAIKQLLLAEVRSEQQQRQQWEEARVRWRVLHSQHAVDLFNQMISSREFAEPAERLACCARLRAAQAAAYEALVAHCANIPGLAPPKMSVQVVQRWAAGFQEWASDWEAQVQQLQAALQQEEDDTEALAQSELCKLRAELCEYAGWSEEDMEQQLQQQCQPVLAARREAAEQLVSSVRAFLERQTQEWVRLGTMLVQWLLSVAHLNEHHQQQVEEEFAQVQEDVNAEQEQFEAADEAREAALDAAVDLLKMGSSESQLDSRLAAALECLKSIQAGYKEHHTASVSIMRQYPPAVQLTNLQYSQQLRELLHVGQRLAGDVAASLGEDAAALQLPSGAAYSMQGSLWAALCDTAPKPWVEAFKAQQAAAAAAATAAVSAEPSSGAAGLAAESSTAAASAAAGKAAAGGKGGAAAAKGKPPAAATTAAAAAAEAEAAAAAAAEKAAAEKAAREAAEAAALVAAEAGPPVPCSLDGSALCERFVVPEAPLTTWVQHLQVDLLLDMEEQASRTQGAAESWSAELEEAATEGLDGQLRRHRPRAGQLSEDVRTRRSTELVGQRRQVEGHMRRQSKAVKQQQATVEEGVRQLQKDAATWASKLQGYSRLLGAALSVKGIDICWREAQSLAVRQQKQLAARLAELRQQVQEGCHEVVAANRRFEEQQLKGVEEGGNYASDSIATYKAGIAGIDHHMENQQQQQAKLDAMEAEVTHTLQQVLSSVEALLPAHKQDMALIESMERSLESAKKKTLTELSRSAAAADSIASLLTQLNALLNQAAAATNSSGSSTELMAAARALVSNVNDLRLQVLKQAQALQYVQSTSLQLTGIPLDLEGDVTPLGGDAAGLGAGGATSKPAAAAGAGARGSSASTGKGGPGAAAPAAAAGKAPPPGSRPATGNKGAPTPGGATEALAAGVQAAIDSCKAEVQAAASAYYSSKAHDRPIYYPAKLPATEAALMEALLQKLQALQQMLDEHMVRAVKQLRTQVITANRLLEAVPAAVLTLLFTHHVACAAQQHDSARQQSEGARQQLVHQLEHHKASLHPGMLHPNRQHELRALQAEETSRQGAAAAHTTASTSSALALVKHHVQQLLLRLQQAAQLLLQLLDGCVMPQDLLPVPSGEDAGDGLQRRTLRQLQQLALAQEEVDAAQAANAAAAAAKAAAALAAAAAAAPAGKGKPSSASGKPPAGAKGADAAAAEVVPQPAPGRPFMLSTWVLEATGFDLGTLGWSEEDAAATALQPAGTTSTPDPADVSITSCDTPCHRAVLRAYRATRLSVQQAVMEQMGQHKQQLLGWVQHEALWAASWQNMLQELDTV